MNVYLECYLHSYIDALLGHDLPVEDDMLQITEIFDISPAWTYRWSIAI